MYFESVFLILFDSQVREYHRQYKEEGLNTRDVLIVAHGHFSRVLISRWINFPLCLGELICLLLRSLLIRLLKVLTSMLNRDLYVFLLSYFAEHF